jgi:hypothetical protein
MMDSYINTLRKLHIISDFDLKLLFINISFLSAGARGGVIVP